MRSLGTGCYSQIREPVATQKPDRTLTIGLFHVHETAIRQPPKLSAIEKTRCPRSARRGFQPFLLKFSKVGKTWYVQLEPILGKGLDVFLGHKCLFGLPRSYLSQNDRIGFLRIDRTILDIFGHKFLVRSMVRSATTRAAPLLKNVQDDRTVIFWTFLGVAIETVRLPIK